MAHEHIMVVDDEEDILELVGYNLERIGYKVTRVDSGEDALRIARDKEPDLILLDLMLPGNRRPRGMQAFQSRITGPPRSR